MIEVVWRHALLRGVLGEGLPYATSCHGTERLLSRAAGVDNSLLRRRPARMFDHHWAAVAGCVPKVKIAIQMCRSA